MGRLNTPKGFFHSLAIDAVQKLNPYQPGKPIEELQRELGLTRVIKLASNENPLGPSAVALNAIDKILKDLCRYPDGSGYQLKSKLSRFLQVMPEQITLGNGSNDILELMARGFAGKGDEIIFSQHAFAVYSLVTQAVGATAIITPAKEWGHDLIAISAAITEKTRIIFLANPNNPTGTWFNRIAFSAFLSSVPESVLIVLDEAYFEFMDCDSYPDGLTFLSAYPNLIVIRTFSKAWGLASLRVGYSISHPGIADILNRIRQPFNVNTVALVAAEAVLDDLDYLHQAVQANKAGQQQIQQGLQQLGVQFIPSIANFISFSVGSGQTVTQVNRSLLEQGVIIRPIENYAMPGFIRVSVGLEDENQYFLDALSRTLNKATKQKETPVDEN